MLSLPSRCWSRGGFGSVLWSWLVSGRRKCQLQVCSTFIGLKGVRSWHILALKDNMSLSPARTLSCLHLPIFLHLSHTNHSSPTCGQCMCTKGYEGDACAISTPVEWLPWEIAVVAASIIVAVVAVVALITLMWRRARHERKSKRSMEGQSVMLSTLVLDSPLLPDGPKAASLKAAHGHLVARSASHRTTAMDRYCCCCCYCCVISDQIIFCNIVSHGDGDSACRGH